jgi:hypothetical protein
VLIFVSGGIPERDGPMRGGYFGLQPAAENIPAEFHDRLGRVTVATTVPQLKTFLEEGGTILTIGSSTILAEHLGLPIRSALMEPQTGGGWRPLARDRFYVPGSLLRVTVDTSEPLAHGMPDAVDVFYDNSPAFRLGPSAARHGLRPVAWFDSAEPLRSGWAWGQHYLEGAVAIVDGQVGQGRLVLFGPEILFRAQPHGTFKFFFNALYAQGPP